jgi:hypothetical protein
LNQFFNSPERVEKLVVVAQSWRGTPWCSNSAVRGERGGVSCHNLPREIYIACGVLSETFPKIVGSPADLKHRRDSIIEKWIDARPEFQRLIIGDDELKPGDLLGIRIAYCTDHLGVLLRDNSFVHVLMHKKTDVDFIDVPPWSQRLLAAWRPVEL